MNAKSWKTTLTGCLLAAFVAAQPFFTTAGFDIKKDWQQVVMAIGIAVFGFISKDYNVSGNPPVNVDETGAPKTVTTPQ